MGNCCTTDSSQNKEINMQRDYKGNKRVNTDKIFDQREILGLRGHDKIYIIMKLQAVFRGHLVRKKVKQQFGFEARTMRFGSYTQGMVPNYDNPLVQAIKRKLGAFNYEPAPKKDGVARQSRGLLTLENGA